MEYTIKKIARMSGVSTRTLRYYDDIDLLKPARINSSGYRIYGEKEIDRLQLILFYRKLDLKLEEIRNILNDPNYSIQSALADHYQQLLLKKAEIDHLLATVKMTMRYHKGEIEMKNHDKFEVFKQAKLAENEMNYGKEIREKYSDEVIDASNQKWSSLTKEQFEQMGKIEQELIENLKQVAKTGDLSSPDAEAAYNNHKTWLSFSWPSYNAEAHKGLGDMYVADQRFAQYYDQKADQKVTSLLRDIIYRYAK